MTEEQEPHVRPVEDPFGFLEDEQAPATVAWGQEQQRRTDGWYALHPEVQELTATLEQLTRADASSSLKRRAGRSFYLRKRPGDERQVLFVGEEDEAVTVYDPLVEDPSGNTSLDGWFPSNEGDKVALLTSVGGTEDSRLTIVATDSGDILDGPIPGARAAALAWLPGGREFYYTRRMLTPDGDIVAPRVVLRHRVGTTPDSDVLLGEPFTQPNTYYGLQTSPDGRWLAVATRRGSSPARGLWLVDTTGKSSPKQLVDEERNSNAVAWFERDGRLYMRIAGAGERGRLVAADPATSDSSRWREVLAEDPGATLKAVRRVEDSNGLSVFVVHWMRDGLSAVSVHDAENGKFLAHVALPGSGNVTGITVDDYPERESLSGFWVGYSDFVTPPCILYYDISIPGQPSPREGFRSKSSAVSRAGRIVTRQTEFSSHDGTPVGLIISQRDRSPNTTPRPLLLTAYGGYGSVMTPSYSAMATAWVNAGGVWAYAAVRGGGEKGRAWHDAGRLDKKINAIEDFNAAARHLIASGLTSSRLLCAMGHSNGGMVVASAVIRQPHLYRGAVCVAPLTDMLRYDVLTLGVNGLPEYGDPCNPEARAWMREYSPYHNVREGEKYPALLFSVGAADARVDPAHARKLCARLQAAGAGQDDAPVLIHVEEDAGHGVLSVSRGAALAARQLGFLAALTGIERIAG
ncbi:prolyl oligopeptidase family serine peptidase [Streptomyces puniciscabiei]|uniref:prolyl oligopeptidase family serine peptidase n=1 Tax=Streptomyces puniciscabiei TaxID=164348 RepID=UPI00332C1B0B